MADLYANGGIRGFDRAFRGVLRRAVLNSTGLLLVLSPLLQAAGPVIIQAPEPLTVIEGQSAVFTVEASGTPPLSYQWKKGKAKIDGATNATLVLEAVNATDAGNYKVEVANPDGKVTTPDAALTVLLLPRITTEPVDRNLKVGDDADLSVSVSGTSPFTYQWYFNGQPIPGATANKLPLRGVTTDHTGDYFVVVSNPAGTTTSRTARITVFEKPLLTELPAALTVIEGQTAVFQVQATGTEPLQYQWKFEGAKIPSATNAVLVLDAVQPAQAGKYKVEVSNYAGTVASPDTMLTVLVLPRITTEPVDRNLKVGDDADLSVSVSGTSPFTYQWYFNGQPIPGATANKLPLRGVTTDHTGDYLVVVSNPAGTTTSRTARVTVFEKPVLTQLPAPLTVIEGQTAVFQVQATGTEPLQYQWKFEGAKIPSATNAVLVLDAVQPAQAGKYKVEVSNYAGTVASPDVVLTVIVPAHITTEPSDRTAVQGTDTSLSVSAGGTGPLTYQWWFEGAPLAGATGNKLDLRSIQPDQAGRYWVVVQNSAGVVTSRVATVEVLIPPSITAQPEPQTVVEGENVIFSVTASGTEPLEYQWKFEGANILGATQPLLILPDVTSAQAGRYRVQVKNAAGQVLSSEVQLTVLIPPRIVAQPASLDVDAGMNVALTVEATGTAPLYYQWFKDGEAIAGAITPTLNLVSVGAAQAGLYQVQVTNEVGAVMSQPATVRLTAPPTILVQPIDQSVSPGSDVILSVVASGVPNPSYQWRREGVDIPGATNATLVLHQVTAADSGRYRVVVSNSKGFVVSTPAHVTVLVPWLPFADAFADRGLIYTPSGTGRGTNDTATFELGEPVHAGKRRATNSVWLSWWAPANGIATFSTAGSDFDTILAVYQYDPASGFRVIATDDDSADYHDSLVKFNAHAGAYYQIAVAGRRGDGGNIVFSWELEAVNEWLPEIVEAPRDQTAKFNDTLALTVQFTSDLPTALQWFFQGQPIPGATNEVFVIDSLQRERVGKYYVQLTLPSGRSVVSPPADIQINSVGYTNVAARNKFDDAFDWPLLETAAPLGGGIAPKRAPKGEGGPPPSRGYSGTQIFSTVGADKEEGEPDHCGEPGGASEWFFYQAPMSGLLRFDTDGSDFDTVLAVYTGNGFDFNSLVPVACDDNSGSNGVTSRVVFPCTEGTVYLVAVDGVGGASGTVHLNYLLGSAPQIYSSPVDQLTQIGGDATFTATATGFPAPTWQWLHNGLVVAGASDSTLVLTGCQPADGGTYWAVASNEFGAVPTQAAQLIVANPPQLASWSADPGGGMQLHITGDPNLTYVIEYSTNLVHWLPLATNLSVYGEWDFTDPSAATRPCSFYRVRVQP